MSNSVVVYFSASGVTQRVAISLAAALDADIFEILPKSIYTKADLDWTNSNSRSTVEMKDKNSRPEICSKLKNISKYDVVYLGFPIWWGREPSVVDTFIDENDLSGKKVVVFCTSGGSPVNGAVDNIKELLSGKANVIDCKRLAGDVSIEDLKIWENGLNCK